MKTPWYMWIVMYVLGFFNMLNEEVNKDKDETKER